MSETIAYDAYAPRVPAAAVKAAAKKVTRKKAKPEVEEPQADALTPEETGEKAVENVASAELRSLIERIERLEEEKATIADDIKDVYGEAKGRGYDLKAMRTIVRLRKQDPNARLEEESILETYKAALGME